MNPDWPGNNTGITWSIGDIYNVDAIISSEIVELYINDTLVFSESLTTTPGRAGLFTFGFNRIEFSEFNLAGFELSHLRPIDDYLEFATMGGELIILNTNGNNWFANYLMNLDSSFDSIKISSEDHQSTFDITIPVLAAEPISNSTIIASYIGNDDSTSICILEQEIGLGKVVYVNIFPLIEAFESDLIQDEISQALVYIMRSLNLETLRDYTIQSEGYFKAIHLSNTTISTDAIIIPSESITAAITIRTGSIEVHYNFATSFNIEGFDFHIVSPQVNIESGKGFYTRSTMNQRFNITSGSSMISAVSIGTPIGMQTFYNVTEITIDPQDNFALLLRLPKFNADAAQFIEIYSQSGLHQITGVYGQNLTIFNGVEFAIGISDTYSLLQNISIEGLWYVNPPPTVHAEISSIFAATPLIVIITPIGLIIFVYLKRKRIL
jgi:hypothetical protein